MCRYWIYSGESKISVTNKTKIKIKVWNILGIDWYSISYNSYFWLYY